jgi:hypothetical protein
MADSCDKCVERKDYVAEGPASETVDKFLKLDLKNNLSMSTAENFVTVSFQLLDFCIYLKYYVFCIPGSTHLTSMNYCP